MPTVNPFRNPRKTDEIEEDGANCTRSFNKKKLGSISPAKWRTKARPQDLGNYEDVSNTRNHKDTEWLEDGVEHRFSGLFDRDRFPWIPNKC